MKFIKNDFCDKILLVLSDNEHCTDKEIKLIIPNTFEASSEKHIPEVSTINNNEIIVMVGTKNHPMDDDHFIEWIGIETDKGFMVKYLKPGDKPEAKFYLTEGEKFLNAISYCNLHSLWSRN